jgi:diguanylate cyclase (GGDEF)-like protein
MTRREEMELNFDKHLLARNRKLAGLLVQTQLALCQSDERYEQAMRGALHDPLTGLPNRVCFLSRLERTVLRYRESHGAGYAVLHLDMDRFKLIIDSLGHHAGDEVLITASRRFAACLGESDTLARIGGDEFAILLDDCADAEQANLIARQIIASLSESFQVRGVEVYITASVGIAVGGESSEPEHLLRDADIALHRAKSDGRNRHQVFDSAMHQRAVALLQLETDLRRAVERDELELHYQPIIETATERVGAFEALIRWRHPQRGLVMPADFIPLAEETGIITSIGQWVLNEACRQTAEWRAKFPEADDVAVAVNLSARQFAEPTLHDQVQEALTASGLPPHCLILEITESTVMEDAKHAAEVLRGLKSLGVKVDIDDFGTGYSSLACLHQFPIDTMKIDRSFVARLDGRPENAAIVRTIIALAHNLNMTVTAEGVETEAQFDQVRLLGAENSQGYLFSKPLGADAATELLRNFAEIKSSCQLRASA